MSALGLVQTGTPLPQPSAAVTELQVAVEDTLASPGRLWVRGTLRGVPEPAVGDGRARPWWPPWPRRIEPAAVPAVVHIEARVGGSVCAADVPLLPGDRFEALLEAHLPRARRGWRVARYRVSHAGRTVEACGLALAPREDARAAVVVVLPLTYTGATHGAQALARSDLGDRLKVLLQRLHHGPAGPQPVYYLACVPPGGVSQAELALAATTLGWPAGNVILLPAERDAPRAALLQGLDRLRWLFAGNLDLVVLNLEPALASPLSSDGFAKPQATATRDDRAIVRRLANPGDDPWALLDGAACRPNGRPVQCLRPVRSGLVPRHAVVFCHGMLAYSMIRMQLPEERNCFAALREFLRERGVRVLFPRVAPTSGVAERARELRDQIRHWTDEPVNLIAHSMGGLDARYMISRLEMGERVCSLTTICTPHRGSYLADWFLANYRNRVPLLLALEAVGINVDGFRDCRPAACAEFNARTSDVPGVRYFSYGGDVPVWRVTPVLRRAWTLLHAVEGPNDAMVSVASAHWGEYLGSVCADHFAQTPDGLFVRPGEDFDSLGFCCRIVENLARRGL
jgi:triacylglycerol lipase